jgi:hypothetical protein
LQESIAAKQQRRITRPLCVICDPLRPSALKNSFNAEIAEDRRERRENISDLFVEITLDCGLFTLVLAERFTRDAILTFNPLAEIDKLTPLSTEGTKRIIFPVDWLTAGWAFHESLKPRHGPQRIKGMRVV